MRSRPLTSFFPASHRRTLWAQMVLCRWIIPLARSKKNANGAHALESGRIHGSTHSLLRSQRTLNLKLAFRNQAKSYVRLPVIHSARQDESLSSNRHSRGRLSCSRGIVHWLSTLVTQTFHVSSFIFHFKCSVELHIQIGRIRINLTSNNIMTCVTANTKLA